MEAELLKQYPLLAEEKLLTEGRYHYFCNGEKQAIEEGFYVYDSPSGMCVRSARWVADAGLSIQVCAQITGPEISEFNVCWREKDFERVMHCHDKSGADVVFPLMRVFMGFVIQSLLQKSGAGRVLIPWIKNPAKRDQLLALDYSDRSAQVLGWENDLCCVQYTGEQYGQDSHFYFDRHAWLRRYRWPQDKNNTWEVRLEGLLGDTQVLPIRFAGVE
jgi:hypothetical protein